MMRSVIFALSFQCMMLFTHNLLAHPDGEVPDRTAGNQLLRTLEKTMPGKWRRAVVPGGLIRDIKETFSWSMGDAKDFHKSGMAVTGEFCEQCVKPVASESLSLFRYEIYPPNSWTEKFPPLIVITALIEGKDSSVLVRYTMLATCDHCMESAKAWQDALSVAKWDGTFLHLTVGDKDLAIELNETSAGAPSFFWSMFENYLWQAIGTISWLGGSIAAAPFVADPWCGCGSTNLAQCRTFHGFMAPAAIATLAIPLLVWQCPGKFRKWLREKLD